MEEEGLNEPQQLDLTYQLTLKNNEPTVEKQIMPLPFFSSSSFTVMKSNAINKRCARHPTQLSRFSGNKGKAFLSLS